MNAEILAVGTELLLGQIVNTNAQFLASQLALYGIDVHYQGVVGDNPKRILEMLDIAAKRSDIILLTGGLGPTVDDLTRDMVAEHVGRQLAVDPALLQELQSFFQSRGRVMPPNNKKQALRIEGADVLPNPRGTAPGQYVHTNQTHYFLLPGPPTEMRPMFLESVVPFLQRLQGEETIYSKVLRMVGIGESAMEEQVRDILQAQTNPTIAPYASEGECSLRITAKAASMEAAKSLIEPCEQQLRERLGAYMYGMDDDTLAIAVGQLLMEKQQQMAVAESCTGGLLGMMMTEAPGSSRYFSGGCITYSNDLKRQLLSVSEDTLRIHGAVSPECAREMASGLHARTNADVCVSITGIAGPEGGSAEKPIGLVYIGLFYNGITNVRQLQLRGDRNQIRIRSAKQALEFVWHTLRSAEK
ncbi:competence/damage-inducible protein A [Fodinisporobacter ferrooxydans]|uniref:Putative competence-damage inducible protein n=1 Tax=Fodinisporobacter ferrooxydans TaxID=2901836 RepID=A0ABY4CHC5_9BACL|nr:competence/damage-inducible protein A [Alicyclobacillaceae bacterium MYW30-H2]